MTSNGHALSANGGTREPQFADGETDPRAGVITGAVDEWEASKRRTKRFYDDGNMSFFWRAHRVLALILFSGALWCISMYTETSTDVVYNTKKGLGVCVVVLCVLGVTHIPDGPFRRPHPAFWKLLMVLSVIYELGLVFVLFQNPNDGRQLVKHIDAELGVPLPEKSYGSNCEIYDRNNTADPWHNVKDKMDGFVAVHFFGWWLKTLVLRDYWMCMVISILFELLEYTFEHQLPNFSECWWDHWLMDALICNGAGIYLGMKTLNYLSMKTYYWRSTWSIKTYRGKLGRAIRQFTPYFWTEFDWRPTSSLKRWFAMLWLIFIFQLAELNTFYLKYTMWVPPQHFLCLGRLAFFLLLASVACREYFQFMEDPNFTKMGTQFWMHNAIIITELFITMKYDWEVVTKPLPRHIMFCWIAGIIGLVVWTLWNFYFHRIFLHLEKKLRDRKRRQALARGSALHDGISSESEVDDTTVRDDIIAGGNVMETQSLTKKKSI